VSREHVRYQQAKNYIQACTNGPLTYLRTLKNASSFFYNSFTGSLRWWPISWAEIQWHETHVFSHIQDPVERRHKGILEYLLITNCEDLLLDTKFQRLIKHVPCMDEHTVSLFEMYGSWCHSIDWIPLYPDHAMTTALTEKLLKVYGQRLFPWDHAEARPASDKMRELCQLLRDIWIDADQGYLPGHTKAYLSRDLDLYDKVMSKFNPHGDQWSSCSWLRQE
jgi:hypothetical protein